MLKRAILLVLPLLILWNVGISAVDDDPICGDANGDGDVNVLDVVHIIWCLYIVPDPGFECDPTYWDYDGSGSATILDIVYLIEYLYKNGPEPICNFEYPQGQLTSVSGCLEVLDKNGILNDDCIAYNYDEESGVLTFTHQNADFNCCFDSLTADISVNSAYIFIDEYEHPEGGMCDCICDYDIGFQFTGILKQVYDLRIHKDYLNNLSGILIILDLVNQPSGVICVE